MDMEADFKSMKRKELQALCKKHGLPANSTNLKMAESLASLLQKKEDKGEEMKHKGCLKGSGGSSGEELFRDVPTTRTLRNRVLVVEGDEGLVRDSKPRKAQTKRTREKDEAPIDPPLPGPSKYKEVEIDEVFGGKRHPKRLRGAVSVKETYAHHGSEMAPPCEEPPLRRSKRIARDEEPPLRRSKRIARDDNSLEEGKKSNSAPKKMVENLSHHSVIDGSKGKENTPVVKMDRSYKHNVDKSAMSRSSRRPLRSLQKK